MSDHVAAAIATGSGLFAATVATANLLRRRRRFARIDDEAQAMERAGAALAGFQPRVAVVASDGAAALVSGTDDSDRTRLALVCAGGRRPVARAIDWNAVRATTRGIVVETGERRIGAVALAGVDALDVRRLAPAASPAAMLIAERLGA